MQKIIPHLWFDKEAKQAAEFYTSIFPNSRITHSSVLDDTPSGSVDVVGMELDGYAFEMISAGPLFKFNPSVSFHVKCKTAEDVDALWAKLAEGGKVLMELGKYPFSERYGWLQDKYGLSWQLIQAGQTEITQRFTPVMMYVGKVCGRAEEAAGFYASVFPGGKATVLARYGKDQAPDKEGTVAYASLALFGQEFGVMDSARPHDFTFNEAISFMVMCADQAEVDHYWEKLSAVPESEQCGWLKDKFGVSWQVVPVDFNEMMGKGTKEQIARLTEAFLKMKKFDIETLRRAFEGD